MAAVALQSRPQGSLHDMHEPGHVAPSASSCRYPRRPPLARNRTPLRRAAVERAPHSAGATARCTSTFAGKVSSKRAETGRAHGTPCWPRAESFLFRIVQDGVLSNVTGWACSEFWAIYRARLTVAYPNPPYPNPSCWCPFGGSSPSWPALCLPLPGRLSPGSRYQRRSKFQKRGLVSCDLVSNWWTSNGLASGCAVSMAPPLNEATPETTTIEVRASEVMAPNSHGMKQRLSK